MLELGQIVIGKALGVHPGLIPRTDSSSNAPSEPRDSFTPSSGRPDFLTRHPGLKGACAGVAAASIPVLALTGAGHSLWALPALALAGVVGGVIGWMESR